MRHRIAVFDYKVVATNPIGGCHRRMLAGLCDEHDFTVFAVEFDNPRPERIGFVRVPAPTRPLALLFLAYHLLAPLCYWLHGLRTGARFDLVQIVESNAAPGHITYSHFCHRAYLREHWRETGASGLRGALRWLDHWLHALAEPAVYRRVARVVVPSRGLATELAREYPATREKLVVIPNPVDLDRMRPTPGLDRVALRRELGLPVASPLLAFVALGHFDRKGLPLVFDALAHPAGPEAALVVVGGEPELVAAYRARARRAGLEGRVVFAGMQRDVRPYLWAADAFVLPSAYEAFPLVALEAAAAGLPLVVSRLHGVEEFVRDGENGFLVERTAQGVRDGIGRLIALPSEARAAMGARARRDVEGYRPAAFVAGWRAFYGGLRVA
jgi:glycosyltransferase involved in cell wall biosynthesis